MVKVDKPYPFPTVKQVIFQIKFSNLFMIENKIGDIQMEIMNRFPKSSKIIRRNIVFADVGPNVKMENLNLIPHEGDSVWKFESEKKYELNITTNSLDISSLTHKTYNYDKPDKFREIIEYTVSRFLKIIPLKMIERIGIRYIDECPVPSRNEEKFKEYYNTALPLHRFNLNDVIKIGFSTEIRKGNYFLRYGERLKNVGDKDVLVLDFDGFAFKIQSEDYLSVLDGLHKLINTEFENSIKEPVINYMESGELPE